MVCALSISACGTIGRPMPAGGLRDERQRHHRGAGEVVAGLVVVDVEQRLEAPGRGEHRQRGLHVDPDVAGVHRQRERLGRRQAGVELVVDEQAPDVAERDPADEVLDVDAAVAQRAAFLVRLGDLGLEGDDALEARLEVGGLRRPVPVTCDRLPSASWARTAVVVVRRARCQSTGRYADRCSDPGSGAPCDGPQPARTGRVPDGPSDVAALRRAYGDRGLAEADLAPDPVAAVRALAGRRPSADGRHRAQRDGAGDGRRRRPAQRPHRAAQGRRRARASSSSPTPARARAASSPPTRAASLVFPWYDARAAGASSSGRSSRSTGRRPRRTSRPGRAGRGWAPGRARSRRSIAGRAELERGVRARSSERFAGTERGAGAAVLGRLPACGRRRWSSGRAGRAGCTTGCATGATPRRRLGGRAPRPLTATPRSALSGAWRSDVNDPRARRRPEPYGGEPGDVPGARGSGDCQVLAGRSAGRTGVSRLADSHLTRPTCTQAADHLLSRVPPTVRHEVRPRDGDFARLIFVGSCRLAMASRRFGGPPGRRRRRDPAAGLARLPPAVVRAGGQQHRPADDRGRGRLAGAT